jgi:hypothetical protein
MPPRSIALLLPPAVCAVLESRIDATGILPPNLVSAIVERIYSDPAARERMHERASGVMDHLLSDELGWGNWPKDLGEALYVSIIIKIWLGDAVAAEKPGLSKEELDQLEEAVLKLIIERKNRIWLTESPLSRSGLPARLMPTGLIPKSQVSS